jgi:hypothetical protein
MRMRILPGCRPVALVMACLVNVAALASPTLGQSLERWYMLEMSGQRAGWSHSTQTRENATITTDTNMLFNLKRGPTEIKVTMGTSVVETDKGEIVTMRSLQKLGAMEVEQKYVFREKDVEVTTTQAGASRTATQPRPEGAFLTPAAAEEFLKQRLASGAKEVTIRTLDPTTGLSPITASYTNFEPAIVKAQGRDIETTKMRVEASNAPGMPSHQYVDAAGVVVRVETQVGGMNVVMTLSTADEAKATGGKAPELMISTFVTPDRPIEKPRTTTHGVYRLSITEGDMPELPATGSQAILESDKGVARVKITADTFTAAPEADASNPAFTAASAAADATDSRILELTQRALKDSGESKAQRAEALRRFTHTFIRRKSLGVGFASATEVARTREGDCSEHGVLLAAMLRADGIPSRVVAGLIYADSFAGSERIFGYHMWTQALLEIDGVKRWVDLDATLGKETPYDATHIALALTDLADGESTTAMARMASVLGRLKIVVEEIR